FERNLPHSGCCVRPRQSRPASSAVPLGRSDNRCPLAGGNTMSMTAPALQQAREFLMDGAAQRITLLRHIKEQGRKITELEREVQKQMTLRDQAEQALIDARKEIEALRAQMPDDATVTAYHNLVDYLTSTSELNPQLRVAA